MAAPAQSSVSRLLAIGSVDSQNLIAMSVTTIGEFKPTIGNKISKPYTCAVHMVEGRQDRVYKIINMNQYNYGDEIRVTELAARLGVGPAFHGAHLVQQDTHVVFVAIEMDYAGQTLQRLIEEECVKAEEESRAALEIQSLTDEKSDLQAEFGHTVAASSITIQPSLKRTITKLGGTEEGFYFELFSKIKTLAEHNIAYVDTNFGNIIPATPQGTRFQLIDFGSAIIISNQQQAACRAGCAGICHLTAYKQLTNLSEESRALIAWFRSHRVNI